MFDDPITKPKNEPEDIFGESKNAPPTNLPTSAPPPKDIIGVPSKIVAPRSTAEQLEEKQSFEEAREKDSIVLEEPKKSWKRLLIIIIAIVAVLGVAAWFALKFTVSKTGTEGKIPEKKEATQEPEQETPVAPAPVTPEFKPSVDSDGDGLSDEEELMLGTDALLADSDADELPDRDEVKVYKTDPLDSDTDKDGYFDGEEVKNGFDPKGKGRLYEVPAP